MAELQVLAGAGRVLLRAQGPLHLLDLQLERVERAEDLLHAVRVVHVAVAVRVLQQLAGVDAAPRPGRLDGQGLDDLARGALRGDRARWALGRRLPATSAWFSSLSRPGTLHTHPLCQAPPAPRTSPPPPEPQVPRGPSPSAARPRPPAPCRVLSAHSPFSATLASCPGPQPRLHTVGPHSCLQRLGLHFAGLRLEAPAKHTGKG